MPDQFSRTKMLLGNEAIEKIKNSYVAVFGIGGVGGFTVEALARAGVMHFDLFDNDIVSKSNINRQIIALSSTLGKYKVDVMKDRILDINPDAKVNCHKVFYLPENSFEFDFSKYSYVVDAVDTVTAKIEIIKRAKEKNIPIISSMGTGNKLCPEKFEIADISKTSVCPLARVMRQELSKRNIKGVKVIYSKEEAIKPESALNEEKRIPGSFSPTPGVAGLIIASEVIKDLIK